MNTTLHLYIPINEHETVNSAIARTNGIIENLFSPYGFTIYEQGENEDAEIPEIKTYFSVDTTAEQVDEILNDYMYQIY